MNIIGLSYISLFKEVIGLPIPVCTSSITDCVHSSIFKRLAKLLDIASIRVFLWSTSGGAIMQNHISGDTNVWKEVDIYKVRATFAHYKKFSFTKIRYVNDDGSTVTIGYIGLYKTAHLTKDDIQFLDIFSLLYGNYIRRRIISDKMNRMEHLMPKLYNLLATSSRPGDAITGTLGIIYKLTSAYKGYYFVVNGDYICGEYLLIKGRKTAILSKTPSIYNPNFIHKLKNIRGSTDLQYDDFSGKILRFIHRFEPEDATTFNYQLYPVYTAGEMVGLWLFLFKKDQISNYINLTDIFRNINPLINQYYKYIFQRRTNKMIINPIFQNRETRINENDIFVIMPFTQNWSDDIWYLVIKEAIISTGLNPIRADDLYGKDIMEDVWSGILRSRLIIADTTGRNPNVFYELGIAHTLGKDVILLTQDVSDIPFDLNRYRHIIYQNNIQGGEKLKKDLAKAIREVLK